jgi:hypothetical protein
MVCATKSNLRKLKDYLTRAHHNRRFGASLLRRHFGGHHMKTDHRLTTSQRELLALDHTIGRLYDKFGDRVDKKADFIEAEERRFTALKCLATARARSPKGMVAKAKAIKAVSVTDDIDRAAAIATSLAGDVLRYFSRAA